MGRVACVVGWVGIICGIVGGVVTGVVGGTVTGTVGFGAEGTVDNPEDGTVAGSVGSVEEGTVEGVVEATVELVAGDDVDSVGFKSVVRLVWVGCVGSANFLQAVKDTSNSVTASSKQSIRRLSELYFTSFAPTV